MNDPKIRSHCLLMALVLTAALLAPVSTHAANITWTNSVSGNWSATNNWSPNQVPGSSDTAVITNRRSTYTVTLNVNAAVAGLVLGAASGGATQTFSINGQTFTLNGQAMVNSNGAFNFVSGNLAGTVASSREP